MCSGTNNNPIMHTNVYRKNPVKFSLPHNCMLVCYCSIALSIQMTIKGAEGYFIVKHFSEQQTAGSRNVMSLQCLASKIGGVAVIEPWLTNSHYGFELHIYDRSNERVTFGDLNDIVKWNRYSTSRHYSPLVSFEYFLENIKNNIMKDLILVEYNCVNGSKDALDYGTAFCDKFGLKFAKHVCFDFMKTVTFSQFKQNVYSGYEPNEVVVLFSQYGGIMREKPIESRSSFRVYMSGTQCYAVDYDCSGLYPSLIVMSDAEEYIYKYMNGTKAYISLMVRIEKSLIYTGHFTPDKASDGAMTCVQNAIERWKQVQKHYGIYSTFLTVDVGTFGSASFNKVKQNTMEAAEHLFSEIYSGTLSLRMWEQRFTTIGKGRTKSSAYIAMMQKVLAAKGNVLITAGGGSFQRSAQKLHQEFYRSPQVVMLQSDCT